MLFLESFLERMKLAVLDQSFHRKDFGAIGLDGEHRARLHGLAIHDHRARTAMRCIAADVGASQREDVADEVNQQDPRFNCSLAIPAIDAYTNEFFLRHCLSLGCV